MKVVWLIESVDGEYIDTSIYNPLIGSSLMQLPKYLVNSKKGLINIEIKVNECFSWCYIKRLSSIKKRISTGQ